MTDQQLIVDPNLPGNQPAGRLEPLPEMAPMAPGLSLIHKGLDKGLDTDTMQALVQMAQDQEDRESSKAYARAMTAAQAEMVPVLRDRRNTQTGSNYATLEAIHRMLYPIYTRHGFSMSFGEAECPIDGWRRTIVDVFHAGGHSRPYHVDLPPDDKGIKGTVNKTGVHAAASTITHARRLLESMVFNVVLTDQEAPDLDGNADADTITPEQAADLEALCSEVGADRDRFLKWLQAESFEALPEAKHSQAVKGLEAKRRKG